MLAPRPLCHGGLVYLGGDGLYALDRKDRSVRWSDPKASATDLCAAGGTLAYSGGSGLLNVDPAGGSVLWSYDQKPGPEPKTVLAAGRILAGDDNAVYALCSVLPVDDAGLPDSARQPGKGIFALSRKNGSVLWMQHRKPEADDSVAAVVTGGTLLYTDSKTNLVARSTATGEQLWFADTDAQALYQPATDGARAFCSSTGTGLQAVTIATGKPAWVKAPPQKRLWFTPPAVGDGVVYSVLGGMTVTLNGTLYTPPAPPLLIAWQAESGTELWRLPLPEEVTMSIPPFLLGRTLFVPTDSKGFYAVDTTGHRFRWVFRNGVTTDIPWRFAGDGGQLIAAQDNQVYALPVD
jgi:outer membrane protein assembly factor BamB